jgi:hypothetical protein
MSSIVTLFIIVFPFSFFFVSVPIYNAWHQCCIPSVNITANSDTSTSRYQCILSSVSCCLKFVTGLIFPQHNEHRIGQYTCGKSTICVVLFVSVNFVKRYKNLFVTVYNKNPTQKIICIGQINNRHKFWTICVGFNYKPTQFVLFLF